MGWIRFGLGVVHWHLEVDVVTWFPLGGDLTWYSSLVAYLVVDSSSSHVAL